MLISKKFNWQSLGKKEWINFITHTSSKTFYEIVVTIQQLVNPTNPFNM